MMDQSKAVLDIVRVLKDIDRSLGKVVRALDRQVQLATDAARERLLFQSESISETVIDDLDVATVVNGEASAEGDVIVYHGDTYHRACTEFVGVRLDGGMSFCIKRVGHSGNVHEAYDGTTREGE